MDLDIYLSCLYPSNDFYQLDEIVIDVSPTQLAIQILDVYTGIRGGRRGAHNQFTYNFHSNLDYGLQRWSCTQNYKQCRAAIYTLNTNNTEYVISMSDTLHNHPQICSYELDAEVVTQKLLTSVPYRTDKDYRIDKFIQINESLFPNS